MRARIYPRHPAADAGPDAASIAPASSRSSSPPRCSWRTLNSTVIATSLPAIAATRRDPIALKLAVTSYLVSLAIFIPVSGWMADRFGARTRLPAAIAVFMAGSLACAAASRSAASSLARFVQGMGGAMMVPVGRLVLLRSVPKNELVQALA